MGDAKSEFPFPERRAWRIAEERKQGEGTPVVINDRPVRLPLGEQGFSRLIDVSRETKERLALYVDLLIDWNRRINLVSPNSIGDIWRRHILDSAQLFRLLPLGDARKPAQLVDLGSGAGLPGLVLAIMGAGEVHLVDSDQRKAAFLREAIRVTGAPAIVHPQRAEKVKGLLADVVTSRALAPLPVLLDLAAPFLKPGGVALFLKGGKAEEELTAAQKVWRMQVQRLPSLSDSSGTILRLETLIREFPDHPV